MKPVIPFRLSTALLALVAGTPALAHDAPHAHVHPLPALLAALAVFALLSLAGATRPKRRRWYAAAGASGVVVFALLRYVA